MPDYPPSLEKLLHELEKLPGVGPRSAQRLAFHLLKQPMENSKLLARGLVEARTKLHPCRDCHNLTEETLCRICLAPGRDNQVILVVEDPSDVIAFERTHEFHGLYHVLGGNLSPLEGRGPGDLNLNSLVERVKTRGRVQGNHRRHRPHGGRGFHRPLYPTPFETVRRQGHPPCPGPALGGGRGIRGRIDPLESPGRAKGIIGCRSSTIFLERLIEKWRKSIFLKTQKGHRKLLGGT